MFPFWYLYTRKEGDIIKKFFSVMLIFTFLPLLLTPAHAARVTDFHDVSSRDWYYGAVDFVVSKGLFQGSSSTSFSPGGTMTRGMFVTVLGRYADVPTFAPGSRFGQTIKSDVNMRNTPSTQNSSVLLTLPNAASLEVLDEVADLMDPVYTWYQVRYMKTVGYIRSDLMTVSDSGFADVSPDTYYYSYVQWAVTAGIATLAADGSFAPEREITREEICCMLANYASYKNYQLNPTVAALNFTDCSSISSTYNTAVSKLQQVGVIGGYTDGSFRPQGTATRAEVSAMLMRFIDALGYKKSTEPSYDASGNYIFGTEVSQKSAVSNDYFSDACFIGHSLVNGMKSFLGLTNADYFAKNGASAKNFLSYNDLELTTTHLDDKGYTVRDKGGLEQALTDKSYGKVYIMLGINEIGSSNSAVQSFSTSMSAILKLVRQTQPNAKIYLISLSPVSRSCSEASVYNRDSIVTFNSVLKQLCKSHSAYYLNVFDLLCDENGFMDSSTVMSDGIHLLAPAYTNIKNYLLTHTA